MCHSESTTTTTKLIIGSIIFMIILSEDMMANVRAEMFLDVINDLAP